MEVCNEGLIQQESPRVRIDAIEESPAEAKDKGSVKSGKVTKPVLLMRRPSIRCVSSHYFHFLFFSFLFLFSPSFSFFKCLTPNPKVCLPETWTKSVDKRLSGT